MERPPAMELQPPSQRQRWPLPLPRCRIALSLWARRTSLVQSFAFSGRDLPQREKVRFPVAVGLAGLKGPLPRSQAGVNLLQVFLAPLTPGSTTAPMEAFVAHAPASILPVRDETSAPDDSQAHQRYAA